MNYSFNRRPSSADDGPAGYQMLAQGSDDEVDPYDNGPRGGNRSGGGRDPRDDHGDSYGRPDRGTGRYEDDFDDDRDKGGRRGSMKHREDDRRGRDYEDDPYTGCYSGYRGFVRQRNAHDMSHQHVVKDEYGVERTQSNKIKIFVSSRSIRVTDYDNEVIDDIALTDICKIDHKHDRGMNDGHRNFLAFNIKDGSVFVINSPQTPDIKSDVMAAVQRNRAVNVGTYRRNY